MQPKMVVASAIRPEDSAQVVLAQDHDVIEAFPADRANQPLRMPILPVWSRCNRVIPEAHRCQTLPDGMTVVPAENYIRQY
jgi:hypothetical protein